MFAVRRVVDRASVRVHLQKTTNESTTSLATDKTTAHNYFVVTGESLSSSNQAGLMQQVYIMLTNPFALQTLQTNHGKPLTIWHTPPIISRRVVVIDMSMCYFSEDATITWRHPGRSIVGDRIERSSIASRGHLLSQDSSARDINVRFFFTCIPCCGAKILFSGGLVADSSTDTTPHNDSLDRKPHSSAVLLIGLLFEIIDSSIQHH